MKVLPGPTKSNQVLAWSPDGRFVVAGGSGDGLMAWDVTAGTPGRRVLGSSHGGRLMQFCPRTGRLYVAFQTGGLWLWDPDTDEERHLAPGSSITSGLAITGDGTALAVHCYGPVRRRTQTRVVLDYTIGAEGTLTETGARTGDRWDDRGSISFRPGTDELFGLGRHVNDELRFVWVRATNRVAGSFLVPPADHMVKRWVLSPDGTRVAWVAERGLYLRRLDDPTTLELPAADGEIRRGLAFHPSGRTLAYTTGPTVRLLDADTFAEVRAFDWGTGKARAVAFSPDGLRAAVSAEGGKGWVTVFDLE